MADPWFLGEVFQSAVPSVANLEGCGTVLGVWVEELTARDVDLVRTYCGDQHRALLRSFPQHAPKEVLKSIQAIPSAVFRPWLKPRSDEQKTIHLDFHVGQELYEDSCPYCRRDPRFKPPVRPSRFKSNVVESCDDLHYSDQYVTRNKDSHLVQVVIKGKREFFGSYVTRELAVLASETVRRLLKLNPGKFRNEVSAKTREIYEEAVTLRMRTLLRARGLLRD
jgi:hypothetical protein